MLILYYIHFIIIRRLIITDLTSLGNMDDFINSHIISLETVQFLISHKDVIKIRGDLLEPQCTFLAKIRFIGDYIILSLHVCLGFPGGSAGKESACNAGDLGSIPGVGEIPWRKERLPTPVFSPGEFHGLSSP